MRSDCSTSCPIRRRWWHGPPSSPSRSPPRHDCAPFNDRFALDGLGGAVCVCVCRRGVTCCSTACRPCSLRASAGTSSCCLIGTLSSSLSSSSSSVRYARCARVSHWPLFRLLAKHERATRCDGTYLFFIHASLISSLLSLQSRAEFVRLVARH
jgi:hypothetical protein